MVLHPAKTVNKKELARVDLESQGAYEPEGVDGGWPVLLAYVRQHADTRSDERGANHFRPILPGPSPGPGPAGPSSGSASSSSSSFPPFPPGPPEEEEEEEEEWEEEEEEEEFSPSSSLSLPSSPSERRQAKKKKKQEDAKNRGKNKKGGKKKPAKNQPPRSGTRAGADDECCGMDEPEEFENVNPGGSEPDPLPEVRAGPAQPSFDKSEHWVQRLVGRRGGEELFREAVCQETRGALQAAMRGNCGWRCFLCPYKVFVHKAGLENHLEKQHAAENNSKRRDPLKHPVRNFLKMARGLYNQLPCAPWDFGLGNFRQEGALRRTVRLCREWNKHVRAARWADPRLGCRRGDFAWVATEVE